jgi:hypothetical protein
LNGWRPRWHEGYTYGHCKDTTGARVAVANAGILGAPGLDAAIRSNGGSMKYITLQKLEILGACIEQRRLFKKLFGSRVAVTEKALLPHADKFSWGWAAKYLLSDTARAEYDKFNWGWAAKYLLSAPALAEYDKVRATAWAEYNKVCATAFIRVYNEE